MIEIAVILACAAVAFAVAQVLKVPPVPVLLVAGFGLGHSGLSGDPEILYDILLLGVGFLLFYVGTELNPERVKQYRSVALRLGFAQFIVLGLIGTGVALLFAHDLLTAAYIALALAASSTLVVVRILQQRRQMFEPFGRTVIGVLLLQDSIVVLLLPFLYRLEDGLAAALVAVALTVGMAGIAYVMLRWIVPWAVERLFADDEYLLLVVLAVLFLFLGATYFLNLPIVTGAFIAGVALSSFPASGFVRLQFSPLSDFFTSLFFIVLGTLATATSVDILLEALAFSAVVLVVTPILVTLVGERSGLSSRAAIESGLLLSQTSEISLVLALNAFFAGSISQDVLSTLILVTAITMMLAPFISTDAVTWFLMRKHPFPHRPYHLDLSVRNQVVLLGVGRHGMALLETLLFAGYDIMVVDDDVALIDDLQRNDVPCIRGEASDPAILKRVGADRADVVISMIRRPKDNLKILRASGDTPVLVRVFEEEDEQMLKEAGAIPISFSRAAAEDFLQWFEEWRRNRVETGEIAAD